MRRRRRWPSSSSSFSLYRTVCAKNCYTQLMRFNSIGGTVAATTASPCISSISLSSRCHINNSRTHSNCSAIWTRTTVWVRSMQAGRHISRNKAMRKWVHHCRQVSRHHLRGVCVVSRRVSELVSINRTKTKPRDWNGGHRLDAALQWSNRKKKKV